MTTQEPVRELEPQVRLRLLAGLAALLVALFTVTTVPGFRSGHAFDTTYDGWLQGTAYVALALVAVVRPLFGRRDRLLWGLFGIAVSLRALGFVLYLGHVRLEDPQPYPSVADYAWLTMDGVLLVALWLLLRRRLRRRSTDIALAAVQTGLTVAGLAVALLFSTLDTISGADLPDDVVVTNLAYPLLDIAMMVLVASALVGTGFRSWSTVTLTLGVTGFAVVDAVFVYQVTAKTYHPGTLLAALSLIATGAIAVSGWLPEVKHPRLPAIEFSRVGLAAILGITAIATLVYAALKQVTFGGVLLPAAALVVGIGRGVWLVDRNRGTALTAVSAKDAELIRFQSLVETSGDFIAMARPDGSVMYVNPAGRRLVGIEDRDVTELTIADLLTEEGLVASREIEQPAVVAEGRWSGQSTLRDHRGGPPIPVAIASFLMRDPDTGEPFALATVQRDISDRVAAQNELQLLADQRQHLLDRLVQAQEDERARIAADVHDDSVQALAAVELRLGLLRRQLADAPQELQETAETLAITVREAIGRLRNLLFDLESPAVETHLAAALGIAAENTFEDRVTWSIVGDTELDLPPGQRVTAYRIAKEAMANVVRHADAHAVVISLARTDGGVEVVVADDGKGFDPTTVEARRGHLGIPAMADRAIIAGGRLELERRPEGGMRVRLWLPEAPSDEASEEASDGASDGGPEGSA
jgi:PAS domain S-box-containing protein